MIPVTEIRWFGRGGAVVPLLAMWDAAGTSIVEVSVGRNVDTRDIETRKWMQACDWVSDGLAAGRSWPAMAAEDAGPRVGWLCATLASLEAAGFGRAGERAGLEWTARV